MYNNRHATMMSFPHLPLALMKMVVGSVEWTRYSLNLGSL